MHCLHAQDLVIALFIVKHRGCKVFKDIFGSEWSVGLKIENKLKEIKKFTGQTWIHSCQIKNLWL